jgi:putative endonuclease
MRDYFVYILASPSRTLYFGVTNDLLRRVWEHKRRATASFTRRYDVTKLVYFEQGEDVSAAIEREKQIKRWPRPRKERLIEQSNAGWLDLSVDW